jgi:hypothetical protein
MGYVVASNDDVLRGEERRGRKRGRAAPKKNLFGARQPLGKELGGKKNFQKGAKPTSCTLTLTLNLNVTLTLTLTPTPTLTLTLETETETETKTETRDKDKTFWLSTTSGCSVSRTKRIKKNPKYYLQRPKSLTSL